MERRSLRRDVLALVGTGLAGGIAGCVDAVTGPGNSSGASASVPEYAAWLPTPEKVPSQGRGRDGYDFRQVDVSTVLQQSSRFDEEASRYVENSLDELQYFENSDDVSRVVVVDSAGTGGTLRFVTVIEGTVDVSTAKKRLREYDDSPTEYDGYSIYDSVYGNDTFRAALSGNAVVVGPERPEGSTVDGLKAVIDAKAGSIDRYHRVDDTVDSVLEAFDGGLYGTRHHPFELDTPPSPIERGLQTVGREVTVEGDRSTIDVVLVYGAPEAVDTDAIRNWAKTKSGYLVRSEDVSVRSSGSRAVATGAIDTAHLTIGMNWTVGVRDPSAGSRGAAP